MARSSLLDVGRLGLAVLLLIGEAVVVLAALNPHVSPAYRAFFINHTIDQWPPCRPAQNQIPRRGPIVPGDLSPGAACALLRYGWSDPEKGGKVWNVGTIARLSVPYQSNVHRLTLVLIAHAPPGQSQRVRLAIGGRAVGTFTVRSAEVAKLTVPVPATEAPAVAEISLHVSNPYSPVWAGENADGRLLGVALVRVYRGSPHDPSKTAR